MNFRPYAEYREAKESWSSLPFDDSIFLPDSAEIVIGPRQFQKAFRVPDIDAPENVTELLEEARLGDRDATDQVVRIVQSAVSQLVSRARRKFPGVRHLESTESDVNEVLIRLFLKSPSNRQYASRSEFLGACFLTAHRMLIDRLRRAMVSGRKPTQPLNAGLEADGEDPAEIVGHLEEIELLELACSALAEDDYALMSLIYISGLSQTEAFRILNLKESTGRDRLKKIHQQLGKTIREHGTGKQQAGSSSK